MQLTGILVRPDGRLQLPAAVPAETIVVEPKIERIVMANVSGRKHDLDKLEGRIIKLTDLPKDEPQGRKPLGRSGQLWVALQALKRDEVYEAKNRDVSHAGSTIRAMVKKAKKAGRDLKTKRVGALAFFWWPNDVSGKSFDED